MLHVRIDQGIYLRTRCSDTHTSVHLSGNRSKATHSNQQAELEVLKFRIVAAIVRPAIKQYQQLAVIGYDIATLRCRTVLYYTVLRYAMLCYAMLCYAMLCYAML